MCDDFEKGLRCFNQNDFEKALLFFRTADDNASLDDTSHNRYTSYHGLSRVYMGDKDGVKLCRKAVVGETRNADVFYNLAMAEHLLNFYDSALLALRRGLNIDPQHSGLLHLQRDLSLSHRYHQGASGMLKQLLGSLLGRRR